ncbi:phage major capsid protein [Aquibium sp. LZ166]|uniref:Phage major capsid protein n=1 Tax=Aquibium pacificus TaxID=3153579 RepID=A0ABV3SBW3_9HYPH
MTRHVKKIETRSALPIETREDDPLAEATAAVEELRSAAEQHRTQLDERLATELRTVTDRIAGIETRLNRPGTQQQEQRNEPAAETRAFGTYLRMGDRAPADELRTLTVSSDPQGGYLAPAELSSEFIRELVEFSPIRSLATVRSTSAPSVSYPRRTGITNAKWKGETQSQEGSEPGFGQVEVPIREVNTFVDISNQLLADSGGAAEAEVRLALAEDFGQKEGLAFVKGTGTLQPEGIMAHAGVGYTFSGNASTLGTNPADLLISHMYALPAAYRARGTWLMNGSTLAAIRKLKDGTTGVYLWQPSYAAGQPETILGRPVIEVPDMDDIGAGAEPILFGDIATAYRIVDRVALSILVNPYLRATDGITRIHATRRVGAAVVQAAAIRKVRCATS